MMFAPARTACVFMDFVVASDIALLKILLLVPPAHPTISRVSLFLSPPLLYRLYNASASKKVITTTYQQGGYETLDTNVFLDCFELKLPLAGDYGRDVVLRKSEDADRGASGSVVIVSD